MCRLSPNAPATNPARVEPPEQPMSPASAMSANIAVPPPGIDSEAMLSVPGQKIPTENPQTAQPNRPSAGIGASEISDAITVIVSEETGGISVAIDGMLKRNLSVAMLEQILRKELVVEETKKSTAAEVFSRFFDKHKVNKDGTEKKN